jgi:tripartite-type tricarboxylate transporter receptor subunit TctC
MNVRKTSALILLSIIGGAMHPSPSAAQSQSTSSGQRYPTKPIRLIVPYAPGGSSDIIARLYGQRLSETMGQTFVVDNRPGAGGVIGTSLLAKASADGYTLILQDMPHTINPAVYGEVPYDPLRDFSPITLVARAPQWLFVHPALAAKTVRELVALAKSQPDALRIGSAGNGSGTHLMAELLMRGAGIRMTHVPYKGAGPAVTATVGGEMNAVFTSMPAAIAFVQSGRLRPVGVTTASRQASYPDVPTFQESGVPNMVLHHWFGFLAPAGQPRSVLERLRSEIVAASAQPAVVERYKALILEPATSSPEDFRKLIASDLARWGKVVRDAGIKAQ